MLRSDDAGATWRRLRTNTNVILVGIDFYDTNYGVVAGLEQSILVTRDGGEAWTGFGPGGAGYYFTDVAFVNRDTIAVVGGENGSNPPVFATSEDGGRTWALVATGLPNMDLGTLHALPNRRILAHESGSAVLYETADLGRNWTPRALPVAAGWFAFVDNTTGVLVGNNNSIHRTTDAGATWNQVLVPNSQYGVDKPFFLNSNLGFYLKTGLILKTADAGATWSSTASIAGPVGSFGDATAGAFFGVGAVDSYHATSDGGATFTEYPTRLLDGPWRISFVSPNVGFVLLRGRNDDIAEIAVTRDGGATWSSTALSRPGVGLLGIFALDASRAWATNNARFLLPDSMKTAIHRTDDGGVTWPALVVLDGWYPAIHFLSANRGFAIGWDTGRHTSIIATTDGGVTWTPAFTGTDVVGFGGLTAVQRWSFLPNGQVGVGSLGDAVVVTRDGGATWLSIVVPNPRITILDATTWVAPGVPGLRSVDAGFSWQDMDTGLDVSVDIGFYDSRNGVAIGVSQTASTRDGGVTWLPGDFLPARTGGVFDVDMVTANAAYTLYSCVGCSGNTLLKTTTAGR